VAEPNKLSTELSVNRIQGSQWDWDFCLWNYSIQEAPKYIFSRC